MASPKRQTKTESLDSVAECVECTFRSKSRGALGSAAIHHDKTGHCVRIAVGRLVTFGDEEKARLRGQPQLPL